MKILLSLILPILMLSCSKDDTDAKPVNPIFHLDKTKGINRGKLWVLPFVKIDPEHRKENGYRYFDFVKFEGNLKGFTKIDHNLFIADNAKEYRLDMKLRGSIPFVINSIYVKGCYYLKVKTSNLNVDFESAIFDTENPIKQLKFKLNQGDTISFQMFSKIVPEGRLKVLKNNHFEMNFIELSN